jgi:hypothetical protein
MAREWGSTEPAGNVVVSAAGEWFQRNPDGSWESGQRRVPDWRAVEALAADELSDPAVYRHEPFLRRT